MRERMYRFYSSVQQVLAPGLLYSQRTYEKVLDQAVFQGARWLELGCGHQILPSWRARQEAALVQWPALLIGLDYDLPSLRRHATIRNRVRGDITALPFMDASFDLVTSNMVFEHLREPQCQLREIKRVLRPKGRLIYHTPNVWGYSAFIARLIPERLKGVLIRVLEGREEEDVFRTYYRINTPRKVRSMAQDAGFEVEMLRLIPSSGKLVMIPPLLIPELLWIRLTMLRHLELLRTNMIVTLRRL